MLLTSNLRWWLTARDASGSSSLMRGVFKPGTTVDAGLAAVDELRSLLVPLSDGVFVRQAVSITQRFSPKPAPTGDTSSHQVGAFFFKADTADQFFAARIAGFPSSITKTSGCGAGIVIDDADTRVQALIDVLTGGIWCNPFSFTLETFLSAYIREEQ